MRSGRSTFRSRSPLAPPPVWIAAGLLLLVSVLWAVLTPATRAPDEVHHLNSILRLADGGGWPGPGDGRLDDGIRTLRELSGATHGGMQTTLPGSVNPRPDAPPWTSVPPTLVEDRASLAELMQEDGTPPGIDQMTQHPPGYYAVMAGIVHLVGAEDWRYDHALFFLRVLTGLAIAGSVPFCVYLASRDLTGRENLARVAAFLPLLIPQLGFIGGAVNNDGVVIAAAAVLMTALVRLMTAGPSVRRLAAVAVAVGVTCWTKGTALPLLPAVPLAVAVAHHRFSSGGVRRRLWRPLRDSVVVLGAAFVLGGWWWALNLLRYGKVQPDGFEVPVNLGRPLLSFGEFLGEFASKVSGSFFGYVGLLEAPLPLLLTRSLTWIFLALMAVGFVSRRRFGERVVLGLVIALTVGGLFVSTFAAHRRTHNFPGLQGRYLFVLLVPILVFVAVGAAWVARLLRVPGRGAVLLAAVAGVGVAAVGLITGLERYYLAEGQSIGHALDLFLAWAPWSWIPLGLLVVAVVVLLLLLAYTEGRAADRHHVTPRPVLRRAAAGRRAPAEARGSRHAVDPRPDVPSA